MGSDPFLLTCINRLYNRFGSAEREGYHQSATLPGPGTYQYQSEFGVDGRGATMGAKRATTATLPIPGPGAYEVSMSNKPSAPMYS